MKILVVEDDKNSAKLMVLFLAQYGTVVHVVDGLAAFSEVMSAVSIGEPFDLIMMDIMMPNMDGIETVQCIRDFERKADVSREQGAKIIMVSALADDTVRAEAYQKGCAAYIRKPVDFKFLGKIIAEEFSMTEVLGDDHGE